MKVLFIGNSHMVAIKDGLDIAKSYLGDSPTFLMAPGSELAVDIADGVITPRAARTMIASPEGRSVRPLSVSAFDAFVVIGLGVGPGQCVRLYKGYRIFGHMEGRRRLISRDACCATIKGLLLDTVAFRVATGLRSHTDKPILVVSQPLPPERVKGATPKSKRQQEIVDRWQVMFDDSVGEQLYDIFIEAANAAARVTRVAFVDQTASSRARAFSRDEFQAKIRVEFDRGAPERINEIEDFSHLNAEYGALMVRHIEAKLAEAEAAAAAH